MPEQRPAPGRIVFRPRFTSVAGLALLLAWAAWGISSLRQPIPMLVGGSPMGGTERLTRIPTWVFCGLDFQHNYAAANVWLAGKDPYRALVNDPMNGRYTYPPPTLLAFSWVKLFPVASAEPLSLSAQGQVIEFAYPRVAVFVWMAASVAILAVAAWQTAKARVLLGLPRLPLLLVTGLVLTSYPVMFELERGNCDVIPLLAIVGIAVLVQRPRSWAGDLGIAAAVALAAGIKAYPGIMILGLLALRNIRAALLAAGLIGLMVAVSWDAWAAWGRIILGMTGPGTEAEAYMDYSHSLAMHWSLLARDWHLPAMPRISGTAVVTAVVLAGVAQVGWRVFRADAPGRYAYPFLLWLTAMGTLVNKIAFDYNLIFIPFALLALWSLNDRWWVQLTAVTVALWCQPFFFGVSGAPLLIVKCLGVVGIGQLICSRIRRDGPASGPALTSRLKCAPDSGGRTERDLRAPA